jgi:hypothetical protein
MRRFRRVSGHRSPTPGEVTVVADQEEGRGVTTDAMPQESPDELEAALDEVITHMRDELAHGSWPTSFDRR